MHPVFIHIGPLVIRWYGGVMIALACFVGMWLAGREAERKGIGKEKIEGFFLYTFIGAIIGARLFRDYNAGIYLEPPCLCHGAWDGKQHDGSLGIRSLGLVSEMAKQG